LNAWGTLSAPGWPLGMGIPGFSRSWWLTHRFLTAGHSGSGVWPRCSPTDIYQAFASTVVTFGDHPFMSSHGRCVRLHGRRLTNTEIRVPDTEEEERDRNSPKIPLQAHRSAESRVEHRKRRTAEASSRREQTQPPRSQQHRPSLDMMCMGHGRQRQGVQRLPCGTSWTAEALHAGCRCVLVGSLSRRRSMGWQVGLYWCSRGPRKLPWTGRCRFGRPGLGNLCSGFEPAMGSSCFRESDGMRLQVEAQFTEFAITFTRSSCRTLRVVDFET
jgi:hypothetical protein